MLPGPRWRFIGSTALVTLSLALFGLAHFSMQWRSGLRSSSAAPGQVATIEQSRPNYTASTTSVFSPPTVTSIAIKFNDTMAREETRVVSVEVKKFTEMIDLFSPKSAAGTSPVLLKPIEAANRAMEVKLVSSGFEVAGLSSSREGARYPLRYHWTISPRSEGEHVLLLDVSDIVDSAFSDASSAGKTDVRIGARTVELEDGIRLPLTVKVTGAFGLPSWVFNVAGMALAFGSFVLSYPLVVDRLKIRLSSRAAPPVPTADPTNAQRAPPPPAPAQGAEPAQQARPHQ